MSSRDWKMTHTINYGSYKTWLINRFFLTFGYCAKKLSTFKYRNCIKIHSLLNIATKGISLPFHNCKFFVTLNILSDLSDKTSCDIYTLYNIHVFQMSAIFTTDLFWLSSYLFVLGGCNEKLSAQIIKLPLGRHRLIRFRSACS